jgi:histidinol-phosphate aminotransferase
MTNLLMVMPYRAYLGKAKAEGFRIGAIWDRKVASAIFGGHAETYLADVRAQADAFWLADFGDPAGYERVLRRAAEEFGADLLYHVGQEASMRLAAQVAEDLGLAVNSAESVHLLNDKLALRRLLAEHGLSPVRFADAPDWPSAAALLDGFGLPAVVKPTRLSGSRGVALIHDRAGFAEWGAGLDAVGYTGPVLVEEYLTGPEFSVETISVRGEHHVVGVTGKKLGPPPLFVETGHAHPVPASADTARVSELVVAMLNTARYRTGPAHTELRLTPAGPRIIESQARLGGDRIPRLVELSTGVDLERAVFAALAGRAPGPRTRSDVARIHYFALPPGMLREVGGLDAIRALPFVSELSFPFAPGDTVPVTVDWRSRHGFVIVTAASPEQAASRLTEVESLLRVSVDARAHRRGRHLRAAHRTGRTEMTVHPRLRSVVESLPTYRPGPPAVSPSGETFLLGANESPDGPLPSVAAAIAAASAQANRYPDYASTELVGAIADHLGVEAVQVAVGCGSVGVIGNLLSAAAEPGGEVVYAWRSFEAYPTLTKLAGMTPVPVPLRAERHDLTAMAAAVTDRTRAVLVCSPNNPTGTVVHRAELASFLNDLPPRVLVLLDEAYLEYVRDRESPDGLDLLGGHPSLAVVRTFSKAHGLAGLRVGYTVAGPRVAAAARTAGLSFAVNRIAQAAAVASLRAGDELRARVEATVKERARVRSALLDLGATVPDSEANFVWLPLGEDTAAFAATCAAAGVAVRAFPGEGVRVSIGDRRANDAFLAAARNHGG